MKTIVTHLSPDIDAIGAVWLLRKYLPHWNNAIISYVPTGKTLNNKQPDSDPEVIHVDTGYGKFDHHDTDEYTCAARLVFDFLKSNNHIHKKDIEPLDRLIEMITYTDHFHEVYFPNPQDDYYLMFAKDLIHHFKAVSKSDEALLDFGYSVLESCLYGVRQKLRAENDIETGFIFKSFYGKSIGLYCGNSQALTLAQKKGFMLVIQKNPEKGFVKIKLHPKSKKNLKNIFEKLQIEDTNATWIYHPSGKMILNGSAHNPHVTPSHLSLDTIIKIVRKS